MEFVELAESEFRKFAEKHEQASFFQTPEIAELRERKGWQKHYVGVVETTKTAETPKTKTAKILAATMMVSKSTVLGRKIFYAPRGPLIDYENPELLKFFFQNLKAFIKERSGYVFRFDPYYELRQHDIDGRIVEGGFNHEQVVENLKSLKIKVDLHPEQLKWMFALPLKTTSETKTTISDKKLTTTAIEKTTTEIKKSFRPNTRNLINKTLKTGIKLRELKSDELEKFEKMCTATAARKNFMKDNKSLKYYQDMQDLFKDKVKFLMASLNLNDYQKILKQEKSEKEKELKSLEKNPAENKGKIKEAKATLEGLNKKLDKARAIQETEKTDEIDLSCAMFILYGQKEILYLIAGNNENYLSFDAQYLIQWQMIQEAVKNNCERYNFYGISGIFDKTDPSYGMYEFKKGFGGEVIELIGGFEMPVTNFYYVHKILAKLKH